MVDGRTLNFVYFSLVRENIGRAGETLTIPSEVSTLGALVDHLRGCLR